MAKGAKHHLKRLAAPKHWMLSKLGGIYAPRPTVSPHKLRESLPLAVILRNRLKYALTSKETLKIVTRRLVKVDGKIRTDVNFAAGFNDVVSIDKAGKHFRLIYNTRGHFVLHKISEAESKYKLVRVLRTGKAGKGVYGKNPLLTGQDAVIPYIHTSDGRTIRYADPVIKALDTVKLDLTTGKVVGHLKFEVGKQVIITRGNNIGRIGTITLIENHPGSFNIVHIKDADGNTFSTRHINVFVIGTPEDVWISLPKGDKGVKKDIITVRKQKMSKQ